MTKDEGRKTMGITSRFVIRHSYAAVHALAAARAFPSDLFGLQHMLDRIGMPLAQSAICNLKLH
jgi:hypothetical protein